MSSLHLIGIEFSVCTNIEVIKGVFNLFNQLSNFFKNWGMQSGKTEFHASHGLILLHFDIHIQNIAKIPKIFTGKHVEFLVISLETKIWGNRYINIADFALKKW
mgnify:CR=1 FL=1